MRERALGSIHSVWEPGKEDKIQSRAAKLYGGVHKIVGSQLAKLSPKDQARAESLDFDFESPCPLGFSRVSVPLPLETDSMLIIFKSGIEDRASCAVTPDGELDISIAPVRSLIRPDIDEVFLRPGKSEEYLRAMGSAAVTARLDLSE